jgi:putative CocE/NonD family hydrolase
MISSSPAFSVMLLCWILICSQPGFSQDPTAQPGDAEFIRTNYEKAEYRIPMRDGLKLFTTVYSPKDKSRTYPILFTRTPYRVAPYGQDTFPEGLGPSMLLARELYIFVYQDVRGRFMSEGTFMDMRPIVSGMDDQTDESTDAWDTIEWLMKNVENHNGRVGIYGNSYPGFYASCALVNAHPALVAAVPQCPIADWWRDDFHHNGAFFLPHFFNFFYVFGTRRPELTTEWGRRMDHGTPDGYDFFLHKLGALSNVNPKFYENRIAFWDSIVSHPNYDSFWKARNILPHLKDVRPAVMVVGGWYDAEDLYGPLATYAAIESHSPGAQNRIVMGPWRHGGFKRGDASSLGDIFFGNDPAPAPYYLEEVEKKFFDYHLKGMGEAAGPEALMFETGTNRWRSFNAWPPDREMRTLYFREAGALSFNPLVVSSADTADSFISDPAKPVPYSESLSTSMTKEYMVDDQRFAAHRPDVLVYETAPLESDITLAGNLIANLMVSVSGTDADWIVKLIDVYPDDHPPYPHQDKPMGGYQQMVRSEVIRGRFRNFPEFPEPFEPGKVENVRLELLDLLHTFKTGHRIMVQVQSSWFPLVDRNPQKFVENIFQAKDSDFIPATHTLHRSIRNPSALEVGILK